MRRGRLVWLAALLVAHPAAAVAVRVYFDADGDGAYDAREVGAPAVLVSDGDRIYRTDADGRVSLEPVNREAPPRQLFIILPGGHRATSPWHRPWPPATGDTAEVVTFGIQPQQLHPAVHCAVASDPQVTATDAQQVLAQMRAELAPAGARPGFVVVLGDLTEHGTARELSAWRQAEADWPVPLYPLFGGRDGAASEGSRIAAYETELGPAWYAFWSGGRCHVALVSEPELLTGQEQARQLRWLARLLAAVPENSSLVVFGHVPPAAREINRITARHKLEAVCYGHWHENSLWRYDDVPMLGVGPFRGHEWGPGTGSFRRLSFGDDGLVAPVARAGYDKLLRILTPSERQPPERVVFPVRVAAYHSAADISEVTVRLDGGPALPLKAMAPMTWRIDLPAQQASRLAVTARTPDGQSWSLKVAVPNAAAPPGIRLEAPPPTPPLQRVWLTSTGVPRSMIGELVASEGRLYLGLPSASLPVHAGLVCLDAFSGRTLWQTPTDGGVLREPVLANGRVFAVTTHGVAYAMDAGTGQMLWQRELIPGYPGRHHWSHTGLAVWRDTVACQVAGGPLMILRQADGAVVREIPVAGAFSGAPAILGDLAAVATAGGVSGLDLLSGQQRWFCRAPLLRHGPLSLAGRFGLLMGDGLLAVDLANGALGWKVAGGSESLDLGPVAVGSGVVYPPGPQPLPYRSFTGQALSDAKPYQGAAAGRVALAGDLIWTCSAEGALSAWQADSSAEVWRTDVGLPLKSGPLVLGNAVYVIDFDGNVHAYASARP